MINQAYFHRRAFTVWVVLFILVCVIFFPGLSSSFRLDDLDNLGALASVKESGLFNYIFSGINFPSGRPLSLVTFGLQHNAWPHYPFAFKAVNLLIHILCGVLIFLICRRLAPALRMPENDTLLFCTLVSAFWLLHPIQLTTVLYAVQRMTQLSGLFILAGIYLYLYSRDRYLVKESNQYLLGMGLAVWGGMILAVLSKENGILLPLFILVINTTLLSRENSRDIKLRRCNWFITGLPLIAILIYLAIGFENELDSYKVRSFTMGERLLTETVVLLDYLKSILLPFPGDFSLHHDDFPVSTGLLSPVYTLPAVLTVLLLLLSALLCRARYPVYAFSILWFFAGHTIESSYMNLELYFEHRNYLPSMGILFLVAFLLIRLRNMESVRFNAIAGITIFSFLLLSNTIYQIMLWRDPLKHQLHMVKYHPESTRVVNGLGNRYITTGKFSEAQGLYQDLMDKYPDDIYSRIKLLAMEGCVYGNVIASEYWQDLHMRAGTAPVSPYGVTQELITISAAVSENDCQTIEIDQLIRLIVILALNPQYSGQRAVLHELAARLGVVTGDAGVAYHNISTAVQLSPKIPRLILKFQIVLAMQEYEEAEHTLNEIRRRLDENLRFKLAFADRVSQLEQELNARID